MNIVKVCKLHGELNISQVNKKGKGQYRCKICSRLSSKKHYSNNKITIQEKTKSYRKNNPEKIAKMRHENYIKHGHKYKESWTKSREKWRKNNREKIKEKDRIKSKREVKTLPDAHIKDILTRRSVLSAKDITPEMVELKRISMLIKRGIRHGKFRD